MVNKIIESIEKFLVGRGNSTSSDSSTSAGSSSSTAAFSQKEIADIREEISKRLGEIAVMGLTFAFSGSENKSEKEGEGGMDVFRKFLSRNPQNQLAQLAAFMQASGPSSPPSSSSSSTPSPSPSPSSPVSLSHVTVICFSKDRAFQLKEYLRTLIKYLGNEDEKNTEKKCQMKIHVIYKATEKYVKSYEKLKEMFTSVDWIEEVNFVEQLKVEHI